MITVLVTMIVVVALFFLDLELDQRKKKREFRNRQIEQNKTMLLLQNYNFITDAIEGCTTYEQLETCKELITTRLTMMGALNMAWKLEEKILLKRVEIIAQVYSVTE